MMPRRCFLVLCYLLFLRIITLKIKAMVKNMAPPKQGVKKGLAVPAVQPIVHELLPVQLISSSAKLNQAKTVPQSRTINCAKITFFICF